MGEGQRSKCTIMFHKCGLNGGHPKMSRKKFSEWLADVSRITPTSITTHFHLSKSSHLPYRVKSKIRIFSLFLRKFLLNDPVAFNKFMTYSFVGFGLHLSRVRGFACAAQLPPACGSRAGPGQEIIPLPSSLRPPRCPGIKSNIQIRLSHPTIKV